MDSWTGSGVDDIPGYPAPSNRDGSRLDREAEKGITKLIGEIETNPRADTVQRRSFNFWAASTPVREDRGILARSDGSWTQFEST